MFSLLYLDPKENDRNTGIKQEVLLTDLNLDRVIDKICEDWEGDVHSFYETLPSSKEEEDYRRGIYSDIKDPEIHDFFMDYFKSIKTRDEYTAHKENAYELIQKQAWFLREVYIYVSSNLKLLEDLRSKNVSSRGLKDLIAFLESVTNDKDFISLKDEVNSLWDRLSSFRVILTYDRGRFTLTNAEGVGEYESFLSDLFPGEKKYFRPPFADKEYFSDLEQEILKLFTRKNKTFEKDLDKFCKEHPDPLNSNIWQIEKEIEYYLAYYKFEEKMKLHGFEMCTPERGEDVLKAGQLYDLALAIASLDTGKKVVPNELLLDDKEKFFVLTGPNQGGKTTYARSIGQLIFLSKLGLDVPAVSAEVPYYKNLWTHFSVEESIESGRGKLMDELERLKPIMNGSIEGDFVVINELFTTAANYDAVEMGKKVLKKLTSKGYHGIYVTHLGELVSACDGIVSLRATLDKDNERTFIIGRLTPEYINTIDKEIEKYELTYEQLKERLS